MRHQRYRLSPLLRLAVRSEAAAMQSFVRALEEARAREQEVATLADAVAIVSRVLSDDSPAPSLETAGAACMTGERLVRASAIRCELDRSVADAEARARCARANAEDAHHRYRYAARDAAAQRELEQAFVRRARAERSRRDRRTTDDCALDIWIARLAADGPHASSPGSGACGDDR